MQAETSEDMDVLMREQFGEQQGLEATLVVKQSQVPAAQAACVVRPQLLAFEQVWVMRIISIAPCASHNIYNCTDPRLSGHLQMYACQHE